MKHVIYKSIRFSDTLNDTGYGLDD